MTQVCYVCMGCGKHGHVTINVPPHHPLFLQELHAKVESDHGGKTCMYDKVDYYDARTRRHLWN